MAVRQEVKVVKKEYDKTEDDLKALQSVGQIIGEVLRQLDEERCAPRQHTLALCATATAAAVAAAVAAAAAATQLPDVTSALRTAVIVKASSGPRYVVGCRNKVPPSAGPLVCPLPCMHAYFVRTVRSKRTSWCRAHASLWT